MSVRAKFVLSNYVASVYGQYIDTDGVKVWTPREQRSYTFTPVYSSVEGSENKKFWESSPTGRLELGVVNQAVWPLFELGKEYYLDFIPVE